MALSYFLYLGRACLFVFNIKNIEKIFSISISAFSRHFYPMQLTFHSGYTFFISMCVPWELNPQPFALLTQCSTTEPQEHYILQM